MAIPLQHRRGTKAQNDAFTGLIGEVTVDTENKNLRLHDGLTAGGKKIENSTEISARMSGFKNAIINPAFSVNQYPDIDTAPVAMVHNTYQIDRFKGYLSGVTATIQRLPKALINGKYVNSLKCVTTSTVTGGLWMWQNHENFYSGETKTISVWVKSNNINARVVIYDGVSQTSSNAHSGSGNWELLTATRTINAGATQLRIYVGISDAALGTVPITTGDYIESTMWQLEDGDKATKFEQRDKGLEKILCKPFLPYVSKIGDIFTIHGKGYGYSATQIFIKLDTKTASRIAPTAVSYTGSLILIGGGATIVVSSLAIYAAGTDEENITLLCTVASGGLANESYVLRNNNDATASITVSTEL